MDWQEELISLYVYICKHYENGLWVFGERLSPNIYTKFSDCEVLTVYIWGIFKGHQEIKAIYNYINEHLIEWFPELPQYSTYVLRLNRLSEIFVPLINQIQMDFPELNEAEFVRLIDSMPIMIAKAQRSGTARAACEFANKGYNSTKKTYFYGAKLHIVAFRREGQLPLPDYIGLTPASEADINVLKEIAQDIHGTPLYADKAYVDQSLSELLLLQGSSLNTPVKKKKGQKELFLFEQILSTKVSQVRQPIESLFNWIHEKTGIQIASKVRSFKGLMVHVFGKIAAAMLLLSTNLNS